jgi:hypothetical protein
MRIKEHLQFLVMMIPTVLLLVAAVVTLFLPAGSAGEPAPIVQAQTEGWE